MKHSDQGLAHGKRLVFLVITVSPDTLSLRQRSHKLFMHRPQAAC